MVKGRIIHAISGFYDVQTKNEGRVRARARGNFRKQGIKPLVGDQVEVAQNYLLKIYPRQNSLQRPPIANVDQAIIVVSAVNPNFSTNLLDRYLVYLAHQSIRPLIYVSKMDLLTTTQQATLQSVLTIYQDIQYRLFTNVQARKTDFNSLRRQLCERITVVMGQSGAGKSTLLNQLTPQLHLKTAAISTSLNRGRHTTRAVSLYPIGVDGLLADTPGFSSLEMVGISINELPQLFPEFVKLAAHCRFRGCLHLKEPGCAIKTAVAVGEIKDFRYADYRQLHQEINALPPDYTK